jgi:crotonobetainyl-CoA:carnitine CoA-transferase CaiB-like acyl-CoA transferase
VFHRAQSIGLAWGIINTPDDLLADPHLAALEFFQPVTPAGRDEPLRFPGPPYEFERSPWKLSRRPPAIGEHNGEITRAAGEPAAAPPEGLGMIR